MANYERTSRIDLTTAGTLVAYAVETTAGERPTSGWTHIPGITSTPDYNAAPNMINTTTLDELSEEVGKPGLKSLPTGSAYAANYTNELDKQWNNDVMPKFEAAKKAGLRMWITHVTPDIDNAFYFPAEPSPLAPPADSVSAVKSINLYFTKVGETVEESAPTSISAYKPTSSLSSGY